jgi:Tfp pilus assembly protein FimT
MLILAITAAMVVPSLASFAITRSTDNAVQEIVNQAQYARTQCIAQGKTYRLNFDTQAGQTWLTVSNAGVFQPVSSDIGNKATIASGMKMDVQVTIMPNTNWIMAQNVTATDAQLVPAFGQNVWPLNNTIMQLPRTDPGTYIEFQPSGRTDPVLIRLTDRHGREIDLGLATTTEALHILKPEEMK